MRVYLAYTRATRPTGRKLAEALGVRHGIFTPDFGTPEILVRWGSRKLMGYPTHVLNSARAIAHASDKLRALKIMREEGIPTIDFFETWEAAFKHENDVILGRKRRGMQGRDIVAYQPGCEVPMSGFRHEWYSIYRRPTRELRIHVVGDDVIRVQGKYLDVPEHAERNAHVRNYKTGYRYRAPAQEPHSSRKEWAVEAVKALGLDFGAVDMLLFGSDEECAILEVNTAPACSPLTLSAYADAIERKLDVYRGDQST